MKMSNGQKSIIILEIIILSEVSQMEKGDTKYYHLYAESKIQHKYHNLRYVDDTTIMAESEEELNSRLMKVKEESEKTGIKLNIPKTKIMASSPITSWQIDGQTMETVQTFFSWAPKSLQMVTAAMRLKDACSLEEKL